jgi:hypothetical protein
VVVVVVMAAKTVMEEVKSWLRQSLTERYCEDMQDLASRRSRAMDLEGEYSEK